MGLLCAFYPFLPVCDNTCVGLFIVAMSRLTFNITVWMNGSAKGEANTNKPEAYF